MTNYKTILGEEIKKEIDTDHGVMRAWYRAAKRIHKELHHEQFKQFMRMAQVQWGVKCMDMRGFAIDNEPDSNLY